LSPRATES